MALNMVFSAYFYRFLTQLNHVFNKGKATEVLGHTSITEIR